MKITDIECHVLVVPDLKEDATSSSQGDVVVIVHTEEGITGIGETDVGPWIAKAAIESPGSHSKLLGDAFKDSIVPYASLQPEGTTVKEYGDALLSWLDVARGNGYRAAKIE